MTLHQYPLHICMSCSVYFLFLLLILPFQIQFISITYTVVPKWAALCISCFYSRFRLNHPSFSWILFQIYIHFRLNSYPLHIRELLSVFPGFRPNPVLPTIYIFHWLIYQIFKYISNIYPFQIKIHIHISCFYSRFINFRSNSYPFQIQYISISDPIHIN